jgi:hypothetical protein
MLGVCRQYCEVYEVKKQENWAQQVSRHAVGPDGSVWIAGAVLNEWVGSVEGVYKGLRPIFLHFSQTFLSPFFLFFFTDLSLLSLI